MCADGLPAGSDGCKEKKNLLTCRLGRVDVGRTAGWRVYVHWHAEGGRIRCMRTQISVNKKQKRKNILMGRGGRHSVCMSCVCMRTWMGDVDILRVRADADAGRGHLVCVWMGYW